MSSTTTVVHSPGANPVPSPSSSSNASTDIILRSLYSRAAKSFLNRDIPQAHALITSAFQFIPPPPSAITDPDCQLSAWRRKWDILRLTLETTVYSTPPSEAEELPSSLRANLMLSPQSLLASLHTRSLKLFTPKIWDLDGDGSQRSLSSRYLPSQVVVTLVLASMKLNTPEVGKGMVEDWLSGRDDPEAVIEGGDGYEKIIELYCLHLLPRLEEWDLAAQFLQYEGELDPLKKQQLVATLKNIRSEAHSSRYRPRTPSTPALSPSRSSSQSCSRPSSPTQSSSSESSERTETPQTAKFKLAKAQEDVRSGGNAKNPFDPLSMSSISLPSSLSGSTDTSRTATPIPIPAPPTTTSGNGKSKYKIRHPRQFPSQKQNSASLPNDDSNPLPVQPPISDPSPMIPSSSPGVLVTSSYSQGPLALIRSSYHTWKAYLLSAKPSVGTVLFAIAAVIGLFHYLRTRRRLRIVPGKSTPTIPIGVKEEGLAHLASVGGQLAGSGNKSVVDEVRRRLTAGREQRSGGLLGGLWNETKRAVGDTIQMAGQGLI